MSDLGPFPSFCWFKVWCNLLARSASASAQVTQCVSKRVFHLVAASARQFDILKKEKQMGMIGVEDIYTYIYVLTSGLESIKRGGKVLI